MSLEGVPLCMDWRNLCADLDDGCIDLLFLDPPYNIGKFCKVPAGEYLAWCSEWIAEGSRVLAPNGAFWVSHNVPEVLVDISREIARHGRKRINWVTWWKHNGLTHLGKAAFATGLDQNRSFFPAEEFLVYHADEGDWTAQCGRERGFIFEPLRAYLDDERQRAGVGKAQANRLFDGPNVGQYWWQQRHWQLPTAKNYAILRAGFSRLTPGGECLCREYEDLRCEYEDLRYTFNNPGKVSSVWQIPPAKRNGHPTPKPEALLQRIIEATSDPGDLVLDFFAGSFTTAIVAERLGRRWICADIKPEYVELGRLRLGQPIQAEMALEDN